LHAAFGVVDVDTSARVVDVASPCCSRHTTHSCAAFLLARPDTKGSVECRWGIEKDVAAPGVRRTARDVGCDEDTNSP
jgi:hypothetical protein